MKGREEAKTTPRFPEQVGTHRWGHEMRGGKHTGRERGVRSRPHETSKAEVSSRQLAVRVQGLDERSELVMKTRELLAQGWHLQLRLKRTEDWAFTGNNKR